VQTALPDYSPHADPQSNRAADLPVVLATFVPPPLIEALTSLIVNGFIGPFR
jgi:hypothetical protein